MDSNDQVVRTGHTSSFIKRHSKPTSFVGALIIFMTFEIGDKIRENLRDLVSSNRSAALAGIQCRRLRERGVCAL
jgi:hypothetical protein